MGMSDITGMIMDLLPLIIMLGIFSALMKMLKKF